jgi:hypothetical protein
VRNPSHFQHFGPNNLEKNFQLFLEVQKSSYEFRDKKFVYPEMW